VDRRFLRNTAGWLAASALRLTGAVRRAHRAAIQTDCTLALYFHNPSGDQFARIIRWFQERRYRFLSVSEVESCFKTTTPFPKGSVCISFDDAWRRTLTEVIPIIRDRNLPVTIFIPTQEVRRGTFWFSHVLRNAAALPEPFRRDVRQLWRVPESTRQRMVDHLFEISHPAEREVLSVAEIADLANMPQVTIGSHSVNHALMPNCDEEELRKEIHDSKRDLEQWTGRPVRVFSYPNGDFDERTARVLAAAGYSLAFTAEDRALTLADDPYYIPRSSIMDDGSLSENICHAFGLWSPITKAVKALTPTPNLHGPRLKESESTSGHGTGIFHSS
jgi:peptidoglycan/xylan/chitin deacetylase (PgdA/CDA1 family)